LTTLEVRREIDRFVLYFDTPKHEVNAYALATALVGLADAVREANAVVNPGHAVEVVVEALTDGSFKATVRTVYTKTKNLFSHTAVQAIIYGIIATHIYEKGIKTDTPPNISVTEDLVIIVIGNDKIIVPRNVYEAKQQLEKSERFHNAIGKMFDAAASDPNVIGLAISEEQGEKKPPIIVPREMFAAFQSGQEVDQNTREIIEITHVEISRAIMERGRRRWEFFWRGIRIAAPILDNGFYDKFFAHEITIAPGDSLHVALHVFQEKNKDTGIFVNVRYEITEVYEHVPRLKQTVF
jgi:hypothetical protein